MCHFSKVIQITELVASLLHFHVTEKETHSVMCLQLQISYFKKEGFLVFRIVR